MRLWAHEGGKHSLLQSLGAYIKSVKYTDTKYMGHLRLCTVTRDNDKSFPTHICTFNVAHLMTSETRYTYNRITEAIVYHTQFVQCTKKAMPEGCLSVEDTHEPVRICQQRTCTSDDQ